MYWGLYAVNRSISDAEKDKVVGFLRKWTFGSAWSEAAASGFKSDHLIGVLSALAGLLAVIVAWVVKAIMVAGGKLINFDSEVSETKDTENTSTTVTDDSEEPEPEPDSNTSYHLQNDHLLPLLNRVHNAATDIPVLLLRFLVPVFAGFAASRFLTSSRFDDVFALGWKLIFTDSISDTYF